MEKYRLKKAIIKTINNREPNELPGFIVDKQGDLVRYIPDKPLPRRPVIHSGTFKMAEVWPQPKN